MKWYEDPIYIRMSEKAKEIQRKYEPSEGDFLADITNNTTTVFCSCCYVTSAIRANVRRETPSIQQRVWLPTQSQLQGMVNEILDYSTLAKSLRCLASFEDNYCRAFPTMEQLWLAFVMKENYNKIWNGEDWV